MLLKPSYFIEVLEGADIGRRIPLTGDTITLGRKTPAPQTPEKNDGTIPAVLFDEQSVSRFHALLEWDSREESYAIIHKSRTNTTTVNKEPVEKRILKSGDSITLGLLVFSYMKEDTDSAGTGMEMTPAEPREKAGTAPEENESLTVPLSPENRAIAITSAQQIAARDSMEEAEPPAAMAVPEKDNPPPGASFWIEVIKGADRGKRHLIKGHTVTLGRKVPSRKNSATVSENAVLFAEQSVSRIHAVLEWDTREESYVIIHKSQTNSTSVNSEPVEKKVLRSGDCITLGLLIFKYTEEEAPEECAPRIVLPKRKAEIPAKSLPETPSEAPDPEPQQEKKRFYYRARVLRGDIIADTIEADNEEEALRHLRKMDVRLVSIEEIKGTGAQRSRERRRQAAPSKLRQSAENLVDSLSRVSLRTICIFTQQFSILLNAGVTVTGSLRSIQKGEDDRKFKKILESMTHSIETGSSLSQIFSSHPDVFNSVYSGLISVGESSGKLDQILARHARDLEKSYQFRNKLISSLTYPATILICAVLAVLAIMIFFVPSFTGMYSTMKMSLPFMTTLLIHIVRVITKPMTWLIILLCAVVFIYFYRNFRTTPVGRLYIDSWKIRLPLIGEILSNNQLFLILLNLSCMLEYSISITDALRIIQGMIDNRVYKNLLNSIILRIRDGETLYDTVKAESYIPGYVSGLIQTGEETGELPGMLTRAAEMIEERISIKLDIFLNLVEPLIITFLAVTVGFIMIAIFVPLYNLLNSFSG